jgi:hypothetical protein
MISIAKKFLRSKWRQFLLTALLLSYMMFWQICLLFWGISRTNDAAGITTGVTILILCVASGFSWMSFIRCHRWRQAESGNEYPELPKWIHLHSDSHFWFSLAFVALMTIPILVFLYVVNFASFAVAAWKNRGLMILSNGAVILCWIYMVQFSYSLWMEKQYFEFINKEKSET